MDKLDNCLKSFNMIYTNTLDSTNIDRIDIENIDINYDNCISLYDLICAFNKLHMAFKKEYEALDKLYLGQDIDIKSFYKKIDDDGNKYRLLDILVHNSDFVDFNYAFLYLRELNGVSMPYITNEMSSRVDDRGYYGKSIRLDAKKVKKYLDLFEKYELLLDLYHYLKNQVVFSNGRYLLSTKINSEKESFLDDMKSFRISFGSNYFTTPGDFISITMNLDNEISVDLRNSRINLDGDNVKVTSEKCLYILKNTYIHGHYLERENSSKKKNDNKEKVKLLTNNMN